MENVRIAVIGLDKDETAFIATAFRYCVNREIATYESADAFIREHTTAEETDIVIVACPIGSGDDNSVVTSIRKHSPGVLCIITSDDPSHEERARLSGADGFLAKPYTVHDLFAIVDAFIVP